MNYENICPYCDTELPASSGRKCICDRCTKLRPYVNKYGLTVKEYDKIIKEQDGRCAICNDILSTDSSEGRLPSIDHCHQLEHVRGILCGNCNMGLGHFKDNIYRLKSAIKYLKENEITRTWYFQKQFEE
ncbi:MAG TPA: endonuclease VII domain-containing protein [Bacteroidia bacterium]|jgi:hypothetical protein|nr:endonuclease VII domain-containing protein [Bacteroidia bacterium]